MSESCTAALRQPARRLNAGAIGWVVFEWARFPYVVVCASYLFLPYVATVVVGDPVRGQEVIARWYMIAGVILPVTAPFLGAFLDRYGPRKALQAALVGLMIASYVLLYFATPMGTPGLPIWMVGALVIGISVAYAYTEVIINSMLPLVASRRNVARVSALSYALGNVASVALLLFALWGLALPGQVSFGGIIPAQPILGLEASENQPTRILPTITGIWLLIFCIPFFRSTPDARRTGISMGVAARGAMASVIETIRKIPRQRSLATFLVARMLYVDGQNAILMFGGVYAAGAWGWDLAEMCVLGVLLTTAAALGGLIGGYIDEVLTPRRAILAQIVGLIVLLSLLLSISEGRLFFLFDVPVVAQQADWPIFAGWDERIFVMIYCGLAALITAGYSSSRAFFISLVEEGREAELFGMYAVAGTASLWLAPVLVERFTVLTQSARGGMAAINILLALGLIGMLFVKDEKRRIHPAGLPITHK